jgi:hypothetical protein
VHSRNYKQDKDLQAMYVQLLSCIPCIPCIPCQINPNASTMIFQDTSLGDKLTDGVRASE